MNQQTGLIGGFMGVEGAGAITSELAERRRIAKNIIANLRMGLLDLSNSNRLLNFRFSDRSRSNVRVIDEVPDQLYSKLVDRRTLMFAGLPEAEEEPDDEKTDEFLMASEAARLSDEEYVHALRELSEEDETSARGQKIERRLKDKVREALRLPPRPNRETMTPAQYAQEVGFNPSYDLPLPATSGPRNPAHADDVIQTLLFPDQLERKLSGIAEGARASLQEMGVNTLFATFGYLEWYESNSSDKKLFAPLLLYPAELERRRHNHAYRYSITSTGDDTEINLTLRERLRRDFPVALPDFGEDELPETYFRNVQAAIAEMKRWQVRRFVTVGLHAFGRLAMYHDLDPDRWPADKKPHDHKVLVDLLGSIQFRDAFYAEPYDVDKPDIAAKVPVLITEADSSQFSAIVDVMDGRDIAIKGPPGTGKSQTITNIIAAALALNKKVLFVGEKSAALDVVKNRMDKVGLGDFCFELHSARARKKEVLESLDRRIKRTPLFEPEGLEHTTREYERVRTQLARYVNRLNNRTGECGKNLQELLWASLRARHLVSSHKLPATLKKVTIPSSYTMTAADIERRRSVLNELECLSGSFTATYGTPNRHPWKLLKRSDLSLFDQEKLVDLVENWHMSVSAIRNIERHLLEALGVPPFETLAIAHAYNLALQLLAKQATGTAAEVFRKCTSVGTLTKLELFIERLRDAEYLAQSLRHYVERPIAALSYPATVKPIREWLATLPTDAVNLASLLRDLATAASQWRESAGQIQRIGLLARTLFARADIDSPITARTLGALLTGIELLASTRPEVLLSRRPSLLDPTVRLAG